jgi:hypothetical protein
MPSITHWNRLEPRPRAREITASLAARIRDPLWMLTRQWQLGEFQGADSGSPAFAQLSARLGSILGWRTDEGKVRPAPAGMPLEKLVESEPFSPDLALRVELGQTFSRLIAESGAPTEIDAAFRTTYPIEAVPEDQLTAMSDQEAARFLRVCGGRAIDGIALYRAARKALPELPAPTVPDGAKNAVRAALETFLDWVDQVAGPPGRNDPPAWTPERLEYRLELVAASPEGGPLILAAHPGRDGDFDWDALDLRPSKTADIDVPEDAIQPLSTSILPANVRFRGMPNARWWAFESATTDFGAVTPDKSDLAKLVVIDFMIVHSNDWFLTPLHLPVGTVCKIDTLLVTDVFGQVTLVERADAGEAPPAERWTLFSTAIESDPNQVGDIYVVPPSASSATQIGPAVEDIRFFRDEMANMVWAIEHATENGIGQPWPGHERDLANRAATPAEPPTATPDDAGPALHYQIQTKVPENWIPFLPVAIDPRLRDIALERSAMLRPGPGGTPRPIEPLGRILRPTSIGDSPYRVREEEVPRSGVRVSRVICRSRWTDGSTHLWISRRKTAGADQTPSGLHFDEAGSR